MRRGPRAVAPRPFPVSPEAFKPALTTGLIDRGTSASPPRRSVPGAVRFLRRTESKH